MNNKRTDISQIRKYFNGELDAKAMHQLESEALHDPFLMDALDGYEKVGLNQQGNLNDIKDRLQARALKNERRIIPVWYWGVAASVLIVVGVSALYYNYNAVSKKEILTAQVNKTAIKPVPISPLQKSEKDAIEIIQPAQLARNAKKPKGAASEESPVLSETNAPTSAKDRTLIANNKVKEADKNIQGKDSTDLSDIVMNGLATQKKANLEIADTRVAIDTAKKYQLALNSRAQGVQTNPNYNAAKQPVMIQGVVISKDDGLPVPGVNVRVLGSATGTLTDVNGKFALSTAKDKTLSIASLGYESTRVSLKGRDSLQIALNPNNKSLNEVVVVGYGKGRSINQKAHPINGRDDFNRYIKKSALPVDGVEGTVKLKFTVNADGRFTNMSVTKSLNPASDANAISLITNGPGWYGNTNGKPEVVTVKVKYKKPDK